MDTTIRRYMFICILKSALKEPVCLGMTSTVTPSKAQRHHLRLWQWQQASIVRKLPHVTSQLCVTHKCPNCTTKFCGICLITLPHKTRSELTSPAIHRDLPKLKAFSLPSSRMSMCCKMLSATFQVAVRWSEPCKHACNSVKTRRDSNSYSRVPNPILTF